ncbi:SPRY domain protein [compost metagenome]
MIRQDGTKLSGTVNSTYTSSFAVNDVISILVDMSSGSISFWRNGIDLGVAFNDLATLGATIGSKLYLHIGGQNSTLRINFGASAFTYTPPLDYVPYAYEVVNGYLIHDKDKFFSVREDESSIIPVMTSNTAPSGVASASSVFSAEYPAWRAFNYVLTDSWISQYSSGVIQSNQWVRYSFPSPKRIVKYAINTPYATATEQWQIGTAPKSWRFEASNNGTDWVVLDEKLNMDRSIWVNSSGYIQFPIKNEQSYLTYRLFLVSYQYSGATYFQINELQMFEIDQNSLKLIELHSNSVNNFERYGMKKGLGVEMDNEISIKNYIVQVNTTLGSGKVFKQIIDTTKIPIHAISIT